MAQAAEHTGDLFAEIARLLVVSPDPPAGKQSSESASESGVTVRRVTTSATEVSPAAESAPGAGEIRDTQKPAVEPARRPLAFAARLTAVRTPLAQAGAPNAPIEATATPETAGPPEARQLAPVTEQTSSSTGETAVQAVDSQAAAPPAGRAGADGGALVPKTESAAPTSAEKRALATPDQPEQSVASGNATETPRSVESAASGERIEVHLANRAIAISDRNKMLQAVPSGPAADESRSDADKSLSAPTRTSEASGEADNPPREAGRLSAIRSRVDPEPHGGAPPKLPEDLGLEPDAESEADGSVSPEAGTTEGEEAASGTRDTKSPRVESPQAISTHVGSSQRGESHVAREIGELNPAGHHRVSVDMVSRTHPVRATDPGAAAKQHVGEFHRPAEIAEQPARSTQNVERIELRFGGPGADGVDVEVAGQAGRLRVAVRTADHDLTLSLRDSLSSLVNRLDVAGFRAETWIPHSAALIGRGADDAGGAGRHPSGDSGSGNQQGNQSGDNGEQDRRENPAWYEEMEQSAAAGSPAGKETYPWKQLLRP